MSGKKSIDKLIETRLRARLEASQTPTSPEAMSAQNDLLKIAIDWQKVQRKAKVGPEEDGFSTLLKLDDDDEQ